MRRRTVRPYGLSSGPMRIVSLLMALAVFGVLAQRLAEPRTWQILFDLPAEAQSPPDTSRPQPINTLPVLAGPNDLEESERIAAEDLFELVRDQSPLQPPEMHAYWKLMGWSRTASPDQLRARALKDVPFTQLWEQPERYRGKLLHLKLHARRILRYEAPQNPDQIPFTYEAWGWTDESRSFPYVVVFADAPAGLPIGTDVRVELDFVGYFLKTMRYTAFETDRAAPLLIGRIQLPAVRPPDASGSTNPAWFWAMLLLGIPLAALLVWSQSRAHRKSTSESLPDELPTPPGEAAEPPGNRSDP